MDIRKIGIGAVALTAAVTGGYRMNQNHLKKVSLADMHENADVVFDTDSADTYSYGQGSLDPMDAISYVNTDYDYTLTADTDSIDLSKLGSTTVTYTLTVTDQYGQQDTRTFSRVFTVEDDEAPVITLNQDAVGLVKGTDYDPASNIASVTDNVDQNVTYTLDGSVDPNTDGVYSINVKATDSSGNEAETFFIVTVSDDQDTADKVQSVVTTAMANSASTSDVSSAAASAQSAAQASAQQAAEQAAREAAEAAARQAAEEAARQAAEEAARNALGTAGRIDCNGYGAKLYSASLFGDIQSVINAADSAAYDASYGYIADHASQGFKAVFSVGSVMKWTHADGSVSYLTCQAVKYESGNTSWVSDDGTNCLVHSGYSLVTQTCNGNGLMFAFWN
ncbi:MAG: DUF5011 domain-containing protein [Erysipelotrichaceae bacterium]|jgi:hypothetical protein|nr:DUF5011 domain-containing protein [Erysipelotrichaceae bacterium]MCI1325577.1 DUF5011 domain-containing protein [Solobacterium sp.]MCH4044318.1 DUF5011 domain-containing protein [Erysipelotrichaceae bacterium]MCH4121532.1 DUF5011 domain-containing protein [Erysipelotrichaceae bacterium]MCI1362570.1 DUF5011 domain-containing protein [Solobacterium sp.]